MRSYLFSLAPRSLLEDLVAGLGADVISGSTDSDLRGCNRFGMDSGVGGDNAVDNRTLVTVNVEIGNQPVEMIGGKSYLVTKRRGRMYGKQEGDLKTTRPSKIKRPTAQAPGLFLC